MNSYLALLKREFIENKAGFVYAPAVITTVAFGFALLAFLTDPRADIDFDFQYRNANNIFDFVMLVPFGAWAGYLMLALFFYYSDSFNADRRNNALLFWKSMPQSDFKILLSKALAGITIFPLLILGFAAISGVLLYLLHILVAMNVPMISVVNPISAAGVLMSTALVGAVYFLMSVLWFAPFFAWVAGLSTLVGRWSIPLAFLIPVMIVGLEHLLAFGRGPSAHPIANYLANRLDGLPFDERGIENMFFDDGLNVFSLMGEMFARLNYVDLITGLLFSLALIYLASEYRRRWIAA